MKKLVVAVILAIVLFIAAVQTNPTRGEFVVWAKQKLIKDSKNKYLDLGIDLFGDKLINSHTTSTNYVVFSLYEVRALDQQIKVVGIFNHFVPVSKTKLKK